MAPRLSRDDWVAAGLLRLRNAGPSAMTVDALCAALGRTKGSFYHHFPDADAFADAVLAAWEAQATDAVLAALPPGIPPVESLRRLDDAALAIDHTLERAVRLWAATDARTAPVIARVDRRRLDALAQLYAAGTATEGEARRLAAIDYAAFLGFLDLAALHPDLAADAAGLAAALRERLLAGARI